MVRTEDFFSDSESFLVIDHLNDCPRYGVVTEDKTLFTSNSKSELKIMMDLNGLKLELDIVFCLVANTVKSN